MNERQKEVLQSQLNDEKAVLKALESNYKDALAEINSKIELLLARQDADMQHVIYQKQYQEALKTQIQAILETLQANEFETLSEYLAKSYEEGFLGTMYDLQGQGIPLVFPIDQAQVLAAIQTESNLSSTLYAAMGHDIKDLQKKIAGEIGRGLATGMMYSEISRNIASWARIPKNNAMRIARTEAHRIQCKASMNACNKAKEKGADVVKQWDSSLDGKTRPTHRKLDGQIRELDEPFEVNGHKAMQPGDFNRPEEDINCRCAILQRARWALGNDYTKWSEDAPIVIDDDGTTQFTIIDANSYKEFKGFYRDITNQMTMNFK
jgi:SPP1 gp7 family putative phage head morphogenesis protein